MSAGGLPAIVVHGGAGDRDPDAETSQQARLGCQAAAHAGYRVLARGGTALDAVETAVQVLEDDEQFNAGRGACLTRDGTVELDAAIMSGTDLAVGAVAAVSGIRNPISLARSVLEDAEHVLLVGEGAQAFARERGVALVDPSYHVTEARRRSLQEELARRARGDGPRLGGGTVGAVAVDAKGHLASATSTGGMVAKRAGRVGDSPIPGAGTYADDRAGAASATGHGERIMQVLLAKTAVARMAGGEEPAQVAQAVVAEMQARVGGHGGIILVDRQGRLGFAFNTRWMPVAWFQRTPR